MFCTVFYVKLNKFIYKIKILNLQKHYFLNKQFTFCKKTLLFLQKSPFFDQKSAKFTKKVYFFLLKS